jgi:hypothetical protein
VRQPRRQYGQSLHAGDGGGGWRTSASAASRSVLRPTSTTRPPMSPTPSTAPSRSSTSRPAR